jgi:hypothetical protein
VLPAADHVPPKATVVVYGQKLLGYYTPAKMTATSSLEVTSGTGIRVPVSSSGYTGSGP